jgi:glycerol uptake facilitator-like aquaporin
MGIRCRWKWIRVPGRRGKLYGIASAGFASNGYGEHSPGGYSLVACLLTEIVMTFGFSFVIMGSTHGYRWVSDQPAPVPVTGSDPGSR